MNAMNRVQMVFGPRFGANCCSSDCSVKGHFELCLRNVLLRFEQPRTVGSANTSTPSVWNLANLRRFHLNTMRDRTNGYGSVDLVDGNASSKLENRFSDHAAEIDDVGRFIQVYLLTPRKYGA